MRYEFQFSPPAEIEFSKLEKIFQKRIISKLSFWEKTSNPLQYSKRLNSTKERYRFRVGDYRIIVAWKAQKIMVVLVILKIGHRKEIYRTGLG